MQTICFLRKIVMTTFLLLCGIPLYAQIERCEIIRLKDAIVISEYLYSPRHDSCYFEGNHYICFDGKTVLFKNYTDYNGYLIRDYGSNVDIPECLTNGEENKVEDKPVHWFNYDGSYNLEYSEHERRELWRVLSNDFYKRAGKKSIYVVYHFEGEIVMYKMRRKIILKPGYADEFFTLKPVKTSKLAVLKKAERLRSLTAEEAKSMKLEKIDNSYIWLHFGSDIIVGTTNL